MPSHHRLSRAAALATACGTLELAARSAASAQVTASASVGLVSAYLVRGLTVSNRPTLRPELTLSAGAGSAVVSIAMSRWKRISSSTRWSAAAGASVARTRLKAAAID